MQAISRKEGSVEWIGRACLLLLLLLLLLLFGDLSPLLDLAGAVLVGTMPEISASIRRPA